MTALLEVDGLCAGYGRADVLHEIALQIEPASIVAVLGANGAGKTTLLRTLSGLLAPSKGTIRFRGADITKLPVERLVTVGMAHVPEGRAVIAELTVEDNLRLGGLWRKGAGGARDRRLPSCAASPGGRAGDRSVRRRRRRRPPGSGGR